MPYFAKKRRDLGLTADQKGLIIFGVFTGQMTFDIKEVVEKPNFIVVNVLGNMKKYYQVLDLTVNKYAKAFTRKKFHRQLDAGILSEEVNVNCDCL